MIQPDKMLVIFDGETKLDRQNIDSQYKANRTDYSQVEEIDNPFAQLATIKKVLDYLNYKWYETKNCEADDVIASIANDYKGEYDIIISSADKDFYQLINSSVRVFTYRGKMSKMWNESAICEKYNFDAKYFATFKALTGDKSDNIKGVTGIGPATATHLIATYGSLDDIFANICSIKPRLASLLQQGRVHVYSNYSLVQLYSKTGLLEMPLCTISKPTMSSTHILRQLDIL